jgi:hypothetical protein
MIPDKLFVPQKTEAEKLTSCDSQIESCLKIIRQELTKRKQIARNWEDFINSMITNGLDYFEDDFNTMKGKRK